MAKNQKIHSGKKKDICLENLEQGLMIYKAHPLFSRLSGRVLVSNERGMGRKIPYCVDKNGYIFLNKEYLLTPKQWAYGVVHCLLHLAFGHFDAERMPEYVFAKTDGGNGNPSIDIRRWNLACDLYIEKFLTDIKFGEGPSIRQQFENLSGSADERELYEALSRYDIAPKSLEKSKAERKADCIAPFKYEEIRLEGWCMDMEGLEKPIVYEKGAENMYARVFAYALAESASDAVSAAGGHGELRERPLRREERIAQWFINHYPLLGGLASAFEIVSDYKVCQQEEVQIAAVDVTIGKIYLNPAAGLSDEEMKFVLAHEFLHAGLQHHERCQGRNPYLWNVACDFVINGWLVEMQIGTMPADGLLYDAELKNMSAEFIYDKLLEDIRKYEKMGTFRGYGKGDVIESSANGAGKAGRKGGASASEHGTAEKGGVNAGKHGAGRPSGGSPSIQDGFGKLKGVGNAVSFDEFCRNALLMGLEYQQSAERGYIPAGLIEEIRALAMPPIPWEVELAQWFAAHFPALERKRTYARPSRRQASTPDIVRPRYVPDPRLLEDRTFGVIVDTSGSVSDKMLAKALGSIASYAAAKEVPYVRVVFCDAAAYDAGYLASDEIAGRVEIKGRGGTILQEGVNLLESAKDFPKNGPILIITDGWIEEKMQIHREHAFLIPKGRRLPFRTRGEVFYFE